MQFEPIGQWIRLPADKGSGTSDHTSHNRSERCIGYRSEETWIQTMEQQKRRAADYIF